MRRDIEMISAYELTDVEIGLITGIGQTSFPIAIVYDSKFISFRC